MLLQLWGALFMMLQLLQLWGLLQLRLWRLEGPGACTLRSVRCCYRHCPSRGSCQLRKRSCLLHRHCCCCK